MKFVALLSVQPLHLPLLPPHTPQRSTVVAPVVASPSQPNLQTDRRAKAFSTVEVLQAARQLSAQPLV